MPFDAHKEAGVLEHLAKNRMDTTDGMNANLSLGREWGNLTQAERNLTAQALIQDYSNSKWDALPKPVIHLDANGDCNCIDFTSSHLDFHKGPKNVKVANDHEIAIWVSSS